MFITVFTEHVITPKLVLNGNGEFVANFAHFPCACLQPVG